MHLLLEQFLEKWVWPTAPGARGALFRLRITEEKCLKGWELALRGSLTEIEKGLASGSDDWQRRKLRSRPRMGTSLPTSRKSRFSTYPIPART